MRNGEVPPHWSNLVKHPSELVSPENFDLATSWANGFLQSKASPITEDEEAHDKLLLNHHPDISDENIPATSSIEASSNGITQFEEDSRNNPTIEPIPEPNDEPVTDPLLFPTLPDLNKISCRRSSR